MPAPGHGRKGAEDLRVGRARAWDSALQEHLVHRLAGEEIPFQREGPIGEVAQAALRLVAVGVKTVAQHEGLHEEIEVPQSRLGLAGAGAEAGHPAEAVAAPGAGAQPIPLLQRSPDDVPLPLAALDREEMNG